MIYSNEKIYDLFADLSNKIEDLSTLTVILGAIAIAEIIAIVLIGRETEKLTKRIEQLECKKSSEEQG